MQNLILASLSPRRSELLKQAGYTFTVQVSKIKDEIIKEPLPRGIELLALEKALDVSESFSSGIVIGADTAVVTEDMILGKPTDEKEAREMLRTLSGREHKVITAIAFIDTSGCGKTITDYAETKVRMRHIDEEEISAYIKSKEPFDKAGAYGIQGLAAVFIESIEGCFFNVVGLPLNKVHRHLSRLGIKPQWDKTS